MPGGAQWMAIERLCRPKAITVAVLRAAPRRLPCVRKEAQTQQWGARRITWTRSAMPLPNPSINSARHRSKMPSVTEVWRLVSGVRTRTAVSHAPAATRAISLSTRIRSEHTRFYDRRETNFVLHELEQIDDAAGDGAAVLDSCESFIDEWHHIDPILDKNPPQFVPADRRPDGRNAVVSPEETKSLIAAYKSRGFVQLPELGLPYALQCSAAFTLGGVFSSNPLGLFTLTRCAADLLEVHGCDALKQQYLPKLRSGEWMGTMALSEPQAGSSLAAIRTIATPAAPADLPHTRQQNSGSATTATPATPAEYRIRGDKMWTSGAFHDLSSNIIHMLLARTPGAPPGAAGLSLFLVPNILADGSINDVEVISLNRKMGHKAIPNCAWTLGARGEGAVGFLVGPKHKGLQCMFGMMNAMRIEVGLSAASLAKRGFQEALLYAQARQQGGRDIIEYPDVKRMLLLQKAFSEGAFAFCIHAAVLYDKVERGDTAAAPLLDVLTELVKSWPAEWCLEANKLAMQVLGGAGYVQDYAAEQLYRDNRLNMIHEGTAGIHALTLLGRKVQGGKGEALWAAMRSSVAAAEEQAAETLAASASAILADCALDLRIAVDRAQSVTDKLTAATLPKDVALVNAHDYMTLLGHTVIAWTWLRIATAASQALDAQLASKTPADPASDAERFYEGKLHTCSFFFRHELPKTRVLAELLVSLDTTVAGMRPEWF